MISCTEFIPAYSELFSYIENKHGRAEVDAFWEYLFKPDGKGIPLINYVKKSGIRGCFDYWSGSLNEEAADFTMYLSEKRGYFVLDMHTCPSKGRLLKLKDEIGIVPYHDYCLHCDSYRGAVETVGLKYMFDFKGVENAKCSLLIYDPEVFDGRVIVDEDTEIMERKASDNEYFHKDFHSSMNMAIHYLGTKFGIVEVKDYLERYTNNCCKDVLANIRKDGLSAVRDNILDTYAKEKAEDSVNISDDENSLRVEIKYCPAVKHLKQTGREVSPWYYLTTEVVMTVFAKAANSKFEMLNYDDKTGAAIYIFTTNESD